MLCTLVLNGLIDGLEELSWTPGREFDVISVSIDPLETPQRARLTKQKYLRDYGRPETAAGWHFLTGTQENIKRLADAVGFRYKYVEKDKQYVARGSGHDLHAPGPDVAVPVRRPVPGADAAAVAGRGRRRQSRLDDGQGAAVLLPLRCRSGPLRSGRAQSDEVGSGDDVHGGVAGADPVLAAADGATRHTPVPRPRRPRPNNRRRAGPLAGFALPLVGLLGAPGGSRVLPAAGLDRRRRGRRDLLLHLPHLRDFFRLDPRADGGVRVQVPPPRRRGTAAQRRATARAWRWFGRSSPRSWWR